MRDFPIPVVAHGAGSQVEQERLDYLEMPHEMHTFAPPRMPASGHPVASGEALLLLERLLEQMRSWRFGALPGPEFDLALLSAEARRLVNDALGEGEVSARLVGSPALRLQETLFAGVWRVVGEATAGAPARDMILACGAPAELVACARAASRPAAECAPPAAHGEVCNAPAVLAEVLDRAVRHRPGMPAHIVNLSLLPIGPADLGYLQRALGEGAATVLSRGYGNCRITSTGVTDVWWVQYFNSSDSLILNTIEVTELPDVVPAAADDFADSIERLAEWIECLRVEAA